MTNIQNLLNQKSAIIDKMYASINELGGACAYNDAQPDPLTTAEMSFYFSTINENHLNESMSLWLINHQDPSGKWSDYTPDAWEVSMTSWCLLALSTNKSLYKPAIDKAVSWLLSKQDIDGGFFQSDLVEGKNTYATAYACFALYSIDKTQYDEHINRGLNWLRSVQNNDGGFGLFVGDPSEASLTAYVAHFINILSCTDSTIKQLKQQMADYLIKAQRPSGSWTAWFELSDSIEGTCFSLLALLNLNSKDSSIVEKACEFLIHEINLDTLDNWILSSVLFLIITLEKVQLNEKNVYN